MKLIEFLPEHALSVDHSGQVRISHDRDVRLANLVQALTKMGKSREEILWHVKRAKELHSMGRGPAEPQDSYAGADRRKQRKPYYSYVAEDVGACPKCGKKLVSGNDGKKKVKVCLPCKKIIPVEPIDQHVTEVTDKYGYDAAAERIKRERDRKKFLRGLKRDTDANNPTPKHSMSGYAVFPNKKIKEASADIAPDPKLVKDVQDEKKRRADAAKKDAERADKNLKNYQSGNVRANWKKVDEAVKKPFTPYTPGRYVIAKSSGDWVRGDQFHIRKYNGMSNYGPTKGTHTYSIYAPATAEQEAYSDIMSHEEIPMLKKVDNVVHHINEGTRKECKAEYPAVKQYLLSVVRKMEPEFDISIKGYAASDYLGVKIKVKNWDNWNYRELRKKFNAIHKQTNAVLQKKWPFVDFELVDDQGYNFNWSAVTESTPLVIDKNTVIKAVNKHLSYFKELVKDELLSDPGMMEPTQAGEVVGIVLSPFHSDFTPTIADTVLKKTNTNNADWKVIEKIIKTVCWKPLVNIATGIIKKQLTQIDESTPFPTKDALKVGYPELKPGDTIRTRKMSTIGVVTKVEPYSPWSSDAVYFEVEGPPKRLMRTPLSNVTKVPNTVTMHKSPSGKMTNMSPADDDYAINYGKNGLAK